MNVTNRLCNSTNKEVHINWHAGIDITVPSDGHVDLDVSEMDDFRPGKPGSEEVQLMMDSHGIFLRDIDVPFELQALECLKRSVRMNRTHYAEAVNNIKARRAQIGIPNDDSALEETLRQLNFTQLADRIKVMENRIRYYEKHLAPEERKPVREKLDPKRTVPWTNPPKVFETALQCEMWLSEEGEEAQKRHAAWIAANAE